MAVPEGFEVKLFASEPDIRQPVSMTFDDRGRMWVVQYLQYPKPAGLEAVEVDEYLRTRFNRMPEPPPNGPKGIDRITILEDADGDGRFDSAKDFLSDLNLATGVEVGYGGVFVAQSPYLLFYPDRDGDDIPDGAPEVLVSGFGMEDSHAYLNSLLWGPDGWLYGVQGSTSTARIGDLVFNQGIWRYHPITREFELFSEGGGNTWGLDFDSHGNAIAGTNWGGYAMLHQVQGAYYIKNFGKHGELLNPHAYGYFHHVEHPNFKGGHVTCGGIVYHGGSFPKEYEGQYIGANLLSHEIQVQRIERDRSTFRNGYAGELLVANDRWFRPVDCALGPDGSVFIADWHDKRATHVDPKDDWDRSNGRIYKIEAKGTTAVPSFDLNRKSSTDLAALLDHPNHFYRRKANRILAERRDASVVPELLEALENPEEESPIEKLWALYVSGGFEESVAVRLLDHSNVDVRAWTIRLLGDEKRIGKPMWEALAQIAESEPSAVVRCQLAATCKRFPGELSLSILERLLRRDEDADDPFIPLLLWWALEDKAVSHSDGVLWMMDQGGLWPHPIVRGVILERLARRWLAEPTDGNLRSAARLFQLAPDEESRALLVRGFALGVQGKSFDEIPVPLQSLLGHVLTDNPSQGSLLFGLRLSHPAALESALERMASETASETERIQILETLGEISVPEALSPMIALVGSGASERVQEAALRALEKYSDPSIPTVIYSAMDKLSPNLQSRSIQLLAGKEVWAIELLDRVESGAIPKENIPLASQRRMMLHKNDELRNRVESLYGKVGQESQGLLKGRIRGVVSILGLHKGDPSKGQEVFKKACASCHKLFGEGNEIGPDLTSTDRKNRDWAIANIVDPNSIVRPEFQSHVLETHDGAILTGMLVESTPDRVTLITADNERMTFARGDVADLYESNLSLMPEGLLDPMTPEEIQDLFAYLEGEE